MSMLIVSDEDFEFELNKLSSHCEAQIIELPSKGRNGAHEVPEPLRRVITEEALENGGTEEIAKAFGVSKSSVDAYKNGATSTSSYNQPNEQLAITRDKTLNRINNRAKSRLLTALKYITEDKLREQEPRNLASIAKDMSVIVEKTGPKIAPVIQNNNITFYSPRQIAEGNFDVIDAPATT